jgi:hypothetical protein
MKLICFVTLFLTKINTIQGFKFFPLGHNDYKMYLNNDEFTLSLILKDPFVI